MMTRLTIITVNRNNADGLKKTIDSILSQSCQDFEYLIIDGASTDNSVDVIKAAEGKEFIWISEPDTGIYNAMNKGISMASGDYLLFLNSGDTLATDTTIGDIYSQAIDSDVVVGCINFIDAEGLKHIDYQRPYVGKSLYGFLDAMFPHQATLIRASLLKKMGGYDESYRIAADWEFLLRSIILKGCSLAYIPTTVAIFDNTGISSTNGEKMMAEIDTALRNNLPAALYEDYIRVGSIRGDINRLLWLERHPHCLKVFRFMTRAIRRICHK